MKKLSKSVILKKLIEKKWRIAAKLRTPEEWRKAIDTVDDKIVRIQAACIVWWDHFGGRPATDPWANLDDYRVAWKDDHNANNKDVSKALMQIGYPKSVANRRTKLP